MFTSTITDYTCRSHRSTKKRALLRGNELDRLLFRVSIALEQELDVLLTTGTVAWVVFDDAAVERNHSIIHVDVGLGFGVLLRRGGERSDELALTFEADVPKSVDACSDKGTGANGNE